MIRFLIRRPIAVFMTFTAFFILGLVSYFRIPISLLPDIAIPEISVQVTAKQASARELENSMTTPIRRHLQQVSQLRDIRSETRDETGIIHLFFDYGVNTDLAFIEVNEKIDGVMNSLPREAERPRVIKASATDIPVFNLSISLRKDSAYLKGNEKDYLEMGQFADMVLKRRIEQLPEVAMVDITGLPVRQILIKPKQEYLDMLGISLQNIETLLSDNNVEFGSMQIRDGYYEYNVKFGSVLRSTADIENIFLKVNNQVLQLKDIAEIELGIQEKGLSYTNGKKAISMDIIKQADANMRDLQAILKELTDNFEYQYPDLEFTVTQNQTELLDYTISNLVENLWLGFLLVCMVSVFFIQSLRIPLIIGSSVMVSLIICLLFFNLFHISLNIVSLSGLILAVGMMIDNSIIVTDNINQYREMGCPPEEACVKGTEEVIVPMLSSMLTTIAVFVPLVFMSGIAGAIFFDQAFAVAIGLGTSYFIGILLLPVLYYQLYLVPQTTKLAKWKKYFKSNKDYVQIAYDKGIDFVFAHKIIFSALLIVALPFCVLMFNLIPKDRMPSIEQDELIVDIDWNENFHIEKNKERIFKVLKCIQNDVQENTLLIGQQQYILNRDRSMSSSEAQLYIKLKSPDKLKTVEEQLSESIRALSSKANFSFAPPPTVFEKIFDTGEADLIVQLRPEENKAFTSNSLKNLQYKLEEATGIPVEGVAFDKQINIHIDREKLLLYKINYNEVYQALRTAFRDNKIATLHSSTQYLPIFVESNEQNIEKIISETFVYTAERQAFPLHHFVLLAPGEDIKTITAGNNGEYVPLSLYKLRKATKEIAQTESTLKENTTANFHLSGKIFESNKLMLEMTVILFVSLLLMYFILAAQFESFSLPLIVLLEIPIDAAVALLTLYLLGHSLNLMSAIGIIVTCGIVINDSILKISMINELRKQGTPLLEAIHTAGHRRLRAIIMTSLTTILAMVPLLFSFDMGSSLQKPLAIATVSAMIIGTLVSLFVIPLVYYLLYRKKSTVNT